MPHDALRFSPQISALPVIHGSGDSALAVRRMILAERFDCIAVPLPPSFQKTVARAIEYLPRPSAVLQRALPTFSSAWEDEATGQDEDAEPAAASYVPIDPCQPVIAALRIAQGERIKAAFVDLETNRFVPVNRPLPDPYALKQVAPERFAAAMLPALQPLPEGQPTQRVRHMAQRLRDLERSHQSILFVCSALDWPWVRQAYQQRLACEAEDEAVSDVEGYSIAPRTLMFVLGELPFITALYERARSELEDDENLSIDGVKELLLAARDSYRSEFKGRARKITPHLLRQCLKYVRNLALLERRLTPDLYTLVTAARQCAGDQYALHVAEQAREYQPNRGLTVPPQPTESAWPEVKFGIGRGALPDGDVLSLVSRLPGPPLVWRSIELTKRPNRTERQRWQQRWNPFSHCSWPPEDEVIENFRTHVFDKAKAILGQDLARVEKFTTSIKDGIDIRETLRHWYDKQIYVKVMPPARGHLDCVVMLFDSPADPRHYPWRTTWFAEHDKESTLAFFATHFAAEMIGPGIAVATYGGALFLFPPVSIRDIWRDRRLDFATTLEERLLAAGCLHAQAPHVALLSAAPPGATWRRIAQRFKKKLVHVPLGQFSDASLQQLRTVHVLNGKHVRSYAADFIRKA